MTFKLEIDEKEIETVVDDFMNDLATDIFADSQENIVTQGLIDESTLLKSGELNTDKFLEKNITYTALWADTIEFGRLPGSMPPVDSLKGWVFRKLGIRSEKEINKVAWAVAQDIKKRGTDPRPYLGPAIQNNIR